MTCYVLLLTKNTNDIATQCTNFSNVYNPIAPFMDLLVVKSDVLT